MSSPPASPSSKKRAEVKAAAAAAPAAKTSARKEQKIDSKPKSKKELEAERLAQEEAERNKPPQTGSGQFEFQNGAIYSGEWQLFEEGGKKRHGFGRFTNGGEIYEGAWCEGAMTGKGRYVFASGAVYDGEWLNNRFSGRGTYTWPAAPGSSSASYIGDWKENKMEGSGAFLASTGDRYQGLFHNDRFQNAQGHWIAPMQGAQTVQ